MDDIQPTLFFILFCLSGILGRYLILPFVLFIASILNLYVIEIISYEYWFCLYSLINLSTGLILLYLRENASAWLLLFVSGFQAIRAIDYQLGYDALYDVYGYIVSAVTVAQVLIVVMLVVSIKVKRHATG